MCLGACALACRVFEKYISGYFATRNFKLTVSFFLSSFHSKRMLTMEVDMGDAPQPVAREGFGPHMSALPADVRAHIFAFLTPGTHKSDTHAHTRTKKHVNTHTQNRHDEFASKLLGQRSIDTRTANASFMYRRFESRWAGVTCI